MKKITELRTERGRLISTTMAIRLPVEEYAEIVLKARESGQSISRFVRESVRSSRKNLREEA